MQNIEQREMWYEKIQDLPSAEDKLKKAVAKVDRLEKDKRRATGEVFSLKQKVDLLRGLQHKLMQGAPLLPREEQLTEEINAMQKEMDVYRCSGPGNRAVKKQMYEDLCLEQKILMEQRTALHPLKLLPDYGMSHPDAQVVTTDEAEIQEDQARSL